MGPNLYQTQSTNVRKTWLLMAVFFALIVAVGWFASLYYGREIFYFALFFSLFMNIFSYWKSDKIVLRISGAKPVKREEYFDLYNSVENLAITAGLPMPKVYIIDDPVPNAFATGRNKDHAVIAVTSGLLQILDKSELEGVIAHEMAHIGNKDILLQTIVVTLVGLVALLADLFLRYSLFGGGRRGGNRGGGNAQYILMIIGFVFVILSPIVATMIQLTISRKREYLADATGALLTRYPDGLAKALEKIQNYSGKMKNANHAMAHLYIADPYAKNLSRSGGISKKPGFWSRMFMTHPPTEDRIAKLREKKF